MLGLTPLLAIIELCKVKLVSIMLAQGYIGGGDGSSNYTIIDVANVQFDKWLYLKFSSDNMHSAGSAHK